MKINRNIRNLSFLCGGIILATTLVKRNINVNTPSLADQVSLSIDATNQDREMISELSYHLKTTGKLEELTLKNMNLNGEEYNILDITPNVHTINFINCNIKDLTMIEGMSQIRNISFYNCCLEEDVLDFLKNMDSLKSLSLYCNVNESQFKELAEFKHLKTLEIQVSDDFDYNVFENVEVDAFSSLEGFTLIDSSNCSSEIDLSSLCQLSGIKRFHLCTSKQIKNLDFSKYKNIEQLIIPLDSFDDFAFLEEMKNLKSLNLTLPNWILDGKEELLCKAAESIQRNPAAESIHSTIWMSGCPFDLQEIASVEIDKFRKNGQDTKRKRKFISNNDLYF